MLKELEAAKQESGDEYRRWFSDEYFDLFVWITSNGNVTGFQLCYDKPGRERALTWLKESGFFHHQIDAGEQLPTKNRTPILIRDGIFPSPEIERQFDSRSKTIDSHLASFVVKKLIEYRTQGGCL